MSYQATAVKIMIASPSDVQRERLIVRDCIHDWNATYSERSQIVLMPIGWETHSSPDMRGPAQDVIDYQVLAGCDVLVGVFWTRLGTPTSRASSGSVSEIEDHLALGKPVLLYFADTPVAPSSVDADQYAALQAFKSKCRQRGLIDTYSSPEEFRLKFAQHLAKTVLASYWGSTSPVPPDENPEGTRTVTLTPEAATLLLEAVKDPHGSLMRIRFMNGSRVQTNGKAWPETPGAKQEALWWSAIDELEEYGLIRDVGYKGQVYELTRNGWEAGEKAANDA